MTNKNLIVEGPGTDAAVWTITVNRPQVLNALNRETLVELGEAVAAVAASSRVRAVIVTGAGEKSFVAGADISEFTGIDAEGARAHSALGHRVFDALGELAVPVIAAVNGFALGGGLELALGCDFILASENAKLGLVEAKLGLVPGFGGVARLSRRVGRAMASELLFTAGQVPAAEAMRIGLVNRVVPLAELLPEARRVAGLIAAQGPLAVATAKRLLREGENADLRVSNVLEQQSFGLLFASADMREGVKAFQEKRPAAFAGR